MRSRTDILVDLCSFNGFNDLKYENMYIYFGIDNVIKKQELIIF